MHFRSFQRWSFLQPKTAQKPKNVKGCNAMDWAIVIITSIYSCDSPVTRGKPPKNISRNNDFYFFVPSDLWPLDHKLVTLVTLVQHCVSTNLEVSKAFSFWENQRHGKNGRTEGWGATLNVASREGRLIKHSCIVINRQHLQNKMLHVLRFFVNSLIMRFVTRSLRFSVCLI